MFTDKYTMTLGEIKQLAGISDQAIREYERKGIIPSIINEDNGYHLYHYPDLQRIQFLRYYRRMGMSVKEASSLVNASTQETLSLSLQRHADAIRSNIRREEAVLKAIESQTHDLSLISSLLGSFEESTMPEMYVLRCSKNGRILKDRELTSLIKQWSDSMPIVKVGALHKYQHMIDDVQPDPCFLIEAAFQDFVDISNQTFVSRIRPCRCIKTMIRISSYDRDYVHCNTHVVDYLKKSNLTPTGEILTNTIANKYIHPLYPDDPSDYIVEWIPVG